MVTIFFHVFLPLKIILYAMSDVRSLLRSELASRKEPTRSTKKRKVGNEDDSTHKKRRATPVEAAKPEESAVKRPNIPRAPDYHVEEKEEEAESGRETVPGGTEQLERNNDPQEAAENGEEQHASPLLSEESQPQTVDEYEWAAFEREVAAPTRVAQTPAAIAAQATITAAPMSAEELAAEEQRRASGRKAPTREAEVEGEREDAARFLEDEFDEMDQLEERVKILKQKREELRSKKAADTEKHAAPPAEPEEADEPGPADGSSDTNDDDDDDDQDDDDWDDWRFGK